MTGIESQSGDRPVLLFYADFGDTRLPTDLDRLGRSVRRQIKRIANRPTVTGFEMWTRLLVRSLRAAGRTVVVNDYAAACADPSYPVGITGYPTILDWLDLPNPAILGPGMLDHPAVRPQLMADPRHRYYIVTCDWVRRMFEPMYGPTVVDWFAGIDTAGWPDLAGRSKRVDCLVYDKVRWNRDRLEPELIQPVLRELSQRGLTYKVLRYGSHSQTTYRRCLAESRFMLFLCEHETQGFAYQEAMASNLPVLAWDPGFWLDPQRERYTSDPVPASSVPYFGSECGVTFPSPDEFAGALDLFLGRLDTFRPRRWVEEHLSMERSARIYASLYDSIRLDGA